jgi:hypothetical protein
MRKALLLAVFALSAFAQGQSGTVVIPLTASQDVAPPDADVAAELRAILAKMQPSLDAIAADTAQMGNKTKPAVKVPTFTQAQADKIAAKWQHVLKLDDWKIEVNIVPLADIDKDTSADSEMNSVAHIVVMHVLRPEDYAALAARDHGTLYQGKAIIADIENSILHELMHVRVLALVNSSGPMLEMNTEYTVVRLVDALLSMKGGK